MTSDDRFDRRNRSGQAQERSWLEGFVCHIEHVEHPLEVLGSLDRQRAAPLQKAHGLARQTEAPADRGSVGRRLERQGPGPAHRCGRFARQGLANAIEFEGSKSSRLHGWRPGWSGQTPIMTRVGG